MSLEKEFKRKFKREYEPTLWGKQLRREYERLLANEAPTRVMDEIVGYWVENDFEYGSNKDYVLKKAVKRNGKLITFATYLRELPSCPEEMRGIVYSTPAGDWEEV